MIDLHAHSTASDGSLTPTELVWLAKEIGLEVVALTDHDTSAGIFFVSLKCCRVYL